MKRRFVLYLDESGDFQNDIEKKKRGWLPSLIGGVLFEKNNFTMRNIEDIITQNYVHCTELKDKEKQFLYFKRICANQVQFVVINNLECIWVLDNNLTYLNLMTQGIVKIIKYLKQKYEDIFLEILIANRVDTTTGLVKEKSIVGRGEYEKRLKEKIILSSLEGNIESSDWFIETASARIDKRLMIADIVCNTFLTRKTKFSSTHKKYIEHIYQNRDKTLVFHFSESTSEKDFDKYVMDNRLGEAIILLCQKDRKFIENKIFLIEDKIKKMTSSELELQYKFMTAIFDYYLKVNNDYKECIHLLKKILKYIVPLLLIQTINITCKE